MWFSKDIHARGLEWKMSWQFLNVITLDHLLAWVQRLSGSIDEDIEHGGIDSTTSSHIATPLQCGSFVECWGALV